MARFISRHPKYSSGVRSEVVEHFATGKTRTVITALEAKFDVRHTTDYEKEVGVKTFVFPGLPEDRDTRQDMSPDILISAFDSDQEAVVYGWSDEDHELVLKSLRSHPQYGIEFIEVVLPKRPEPWKGYDKLEGHRISEAVLITGVPVLEVIAYERENQNREEVLFELEMLLEDEKPEEVVSA